MRQNQKLAGALDMMRYQRLSPELLPLPNGRKPSNHLRTCKEDDTSYRVRSGSANPAQTHQEANTSSHFLPTPDPFPPEAQQQQHAGNSSNGCDVFLHWGHRKGPRGSRAENRTAGEESTSHPTRQTVKIHRRAAIAGAEKIAAAAAAASMPPPPYTRGANLRPCVPSVTHHNQNRTVEDGSGGVSRSDNKNRSPPPQQPEKPNNKKPAMVVHNGFGPNTTSANRHPDSKGALDHDKDKGTRTEQLEWPRMHVTLSRKEKEEDFLAMKGTKLPQRPKKRAKNIDKALQYCYPGMWLPDLTKGRYEVREKKCTKKKARGLKGMERSMDSDSE